MGREGGQEGQRMRRRDSEKGRKTGRMRRRDSGKGRMKGRDSGKEVREEGRTKYERKRQREVSERGRKQGQGK